MPAIYKMAWTGGSNDHGLMSGLPSGMLAWSV